MFPACITLMWRIAGTLVLSLVAVACATQEAAVTSSTSSTTTTTAPTTTTVVSVTTTSADSVATSEPASTTTTTLPPLLGLGLELIADGFNEPVELAVRKDDDRLFVVERVGFVRGVTQLGAIEEQPFADLRNVVHTGSIEQGLLGLAFHPSDPNRAFVYHSRVDNDNQLVEYAVVDGLLDDTSAEVLIVIDREADKIRHNGGHIEFGPDGLLYLSVGDGARASVNGQDPNTLLGTILRIDVDSAEPYRIPPDNPFVVSGGAPEVFAWGLRNPWRFSIDPVTQALWIGDVGQDTAEEINVAPISDPGRNFGWPIREGDGDFYGGTSESLLSPPALALDHADTPACSITGGPVYRGIHIPEYAGRLFFADWCLGWIKSVAVSADSVGEPLDHSSELSVGMVSTFGVDAAAEILVVDYATGSVYRIVPVR